MTPNNSQQPQHLVARRRSHPQSSLNDPSTLASHEPSPVKHSVSCFSLNNWNVNCRIRVHIRYQDEALRLRAQTNFKQLLQSALEETEASKLFNNNNIAKKALKYRKVLDRMSGVDVNGPQFDVSEFLGVHWCKTIILSEK